MRVTSKEFVSVLAAQLRVPPIGQILPMPSFSSRLNKYRKRARKPTGGLEFEIPLPPQALSTPVSDSSTSVTPQLESAEYIRFYTTNAGNLGSRSSTIPIKAKHSLNIQEKHQDQHVRDLETYRLPWPRPCIW